MHFYQFALTKLEENYSNWLADSLWIKEREIKKKITFECLENKN